MRFFPRKSVSWRRSSQKNRRQRVRRLHHDPLIDRDLIVAGGMPIDRTTPGSIGSSRSPSRPRCERLEDRALMSVQFVVDPLLDNQTNLSVHLRRQSDLAGIHETLRSNDWAAMRRPNGTGSMATPTPATTFSTRIKASALRRGEATARACTPSPSSPATTPITPPPCSRSPSMAMSPRTRPMTLSFTTRSPPCRRGQLDGHRDLGREAPLSFPAFRTTSLSTPKKWK